MMKKTKISCVINYKTLYGKQVKKIKIVEI